MFNKMNVGCGTMCVMVVSTVVLCYMDGRMPCLPAVQHMWCRNITIS